MKKRFRWLIVLAMLSIIWSFGAGPVSFAKEVGQTEPDVFAIQGMLQTLGFYQGPIDGHFGPRTAVSVRAYQKSKGLAVSGSVDSATLRSILQAYARVKTTGGAGTGSDSGQANAGNTNSAGGAFTWSDDEQQLAKLVNQSRMNAGLSPLTFHKELSRVARFKSEDMATSNYFSHDSPSYGSPFQMMSDFGIRYSSAGENIACNQTVQNAHESLMNSPGHRANILSTDFTHIGIGIVSGGKCGAMYTQMFLKP